MTTTSGIDGDESLASGRTLFRITAVIGILAALTAAIGVIGKNYGEELVLGGHTASTENQHVIIGQDTLVLPSNVIRFENQRRSGRTDSVSIYLAWPQLQGYNRENAMRFSDPLDMEALVFADFSQSVMSRDMSGRVEPIYQRLFVGTPRNGPSGLTIHNLSEISGFGSEKLLTGLTHDGKVYAIRCIIPENRKLATSADCQRDVHVGRDLTMLYRFSSNLLPQWQRIERAMLAFAERHISN